MLVCSLVGKEEVSLQTISRNGSYFKLILKENQILLSRRRLCLSLPQRLSPWQALRRLDSREWVWPGSSSCISGAGFPVHPVPQSFRQSQGLPASLLRPVAYKQPQNSLLGKIVLPVSLCQAVLSCSLLLDVVFFFFFFLRLLEWEAVKQRG